MKWARFAVLVPTDMGVMYAFTADTQDEAIKLATDRVDRTDSGALTVVEFNPIALVCRGKPTVDYVSAGPKEGTK